MVLVTQFLKQTWFICLMTFVIGWSGMSNALSSTSHIASVSTAAQVHDHQAVAKMSDPHCAEMAQLDAVQDSLDRQASSCHLIDAAPATMQHCPDCSISFCQSLFVWLSPELIPLSLLRSVETSNNQLIAYQAQHLAGFWQEILRPPRA